MWLFPQKGRARADPKSATKKPNGDLVAPKTLPFVLSAWGTGLQLGAQSAIILAVLILWGISLAKNGITSAPEVPASLFQGGADTALLKARSVLWTWIPGLIMSLYSAFCGAMFDKLTSHQPIMELQQPAARQDTCTTCHAVHERHRKGWRRLVPSILLYGHRQTGPLKDKSTAGMTILLDYTEHWIPIANSIFAFRNRHHLVGACMLIRVLLLFTNGLASSVLSPAVIMLESDINLRSFAYFDGWLASTKYGDSNTPSTVRPAFDIVSANLAHGGSQYPWTTANYSFTPFRPATGGSVPPGNLTGQTFAFSGVLDCVRIENEKLVPSGGGSVVVTPNNDKANSTFVDFTFTDRGCEITQHVLVAAFPPRYSVTWANSSCPFESGSARYGLLAGQYDASEQFLLANFSLLSCKPFIYNSTGTVTVTLSDQENTAVPNAANVTGYSVIHSDILYPPINATVLGSYQSDFFRGWITNLPLYSINDPFASYYSDNMGELTYSLAVHRNASYPFDKEVMQGAFTTAYGAVFATAISLSAYNENTTTNPQPGDFVGRLTVTDRRLFVVPGPAIAVVTIMTLTLLITLWLVRYVRTHQEQLLKNQDLIFGHALLVDKSDDVSGYLRAVRNDVLLKEKQRIATSPAGTVLNGATTKVEEGKAGGDRDRDKRILEKSDLRDHAAHTSALSGWECWLDDEKQTIRLRNPHIDHAEKNPGELSGFLEYSCEDMDAS
ncbi:hypothetical protein QBC46DRAFT_355362 [Diplogelasinospora grovesii]|uniref:Uncharacterized protein n=1 Tax=Diplogelasinospora grovesii TaxID=303347 RepID=A0AAN6N4G8_9PEZI|nr:hypothetical protein QBC46DRAFT_355362 [Diplogelasinospora grovesii]